MGFRLRGLLLVGLAFVSGQPARGEGVVPQLRVGLLRQREPIVFSGPAGVTVRGAGDEDVIAWVPPGQAWQVAAAGERLALLDASGAEVDARQRVLRLLPPEGGLTTLHGMAGHWDRITERDYRGVIEVRRAADLLVAINHLDIETYLRGVISSEMPADYPVEALKAQAVAARGQALIKAGRHRAEGFDLCATQHCQVYGGATSEDARTDRAGASTWGEVLVYEGRLADTLYASTCGGHTADNQDYWPGSSPVPYLQGVPDFEEGSGVGLRFPLSKEQLDSYLKYAPRVNCSQPRYGRAEKLRWWSVVRGDDLAKTLRESVGDFGELLDVRIGERADSGLVLRLDVVGTKRLVTVRGGGEIRRSLGVLNSATFAVEPIMGENLFPVAYIIYGAGWGHQIGMCQVGAAGLAAEGRDYRRILTKYYRGCEIARRY